ncbi:MAG: TetR/AcrR family transcriptional regulator [Proteobacteria bacterium]|nr:TetR/AcrR family transcriptional regulator [Pseudomonadota bacterium]MBU1233835.1 TetR/AcrR family transcriptional regulator [Pseudomonadota bacterium]MBU1417632.1 TetR/AcrR family transcriptional regulator [Pseudomonadota bacterium]MBU1456183.1 TetR/AcrR family transcriptional regulator [Pseudomonadota bacterium]
MSGVREEKKRQTRKAILEAAMTLFGTRGYEKTSVEQLAKAAGIGKGTIYSYFQTKSEIFLALCEDELDFLHKEMSKKANNETPLLETLVDIFMTEFRYVTRNRDFGRVFLRELVFPTELTVERSKEIDNRFIELFIPLFQKAQKRGELRADLELLFAFGHFYSLYLLTISAWYCGRLLEDADVLMLLRMLFKQALSGLAPVLSPSQQLPTNHES